MGLTKHRTKNTPTKSTFASVKKHLHEITNEKNKPRVLLTGNEFHQDNTESALLTSPDLTKTRDTMYLTDSWQILSTDPYEISIKRVGKWFEIADEMSNTMKEKHTQLTRANYYPIKG